MTIRWTGTQAVNGKRTALDGQSTNHIYKGDPLVRCDQRDACWINAVCKEKLVSSAAPNQSSQVRGGKKPSERTSR